MISNGFHFVVYNEEDITQELDVKIRENLCATFPHSAWYFKDYRGWNGAFPDWSLIGLDASDNPIAHCGIIERDIRIEDQSYVIFGVQNVYVLESHRGKGLAKELMKRVEAEGVRRELDFGLLFARPRVAKLYLDLGWVEVKDAVLIVQSKGGKECQREFVHDILFFKGLREEQIPPGTVYFNGPDW